MSKASIKENLAVVRQQLSQAVTEAGRSPEEIKLIAVSKKKPAAMINEAILANHTAFGENMIQEAINKMSEFNQIDKIEWHMIGHLQKNKVKFCPGNFHWIHSIDSTELAKKLEERCATKQQNINVLIQLNLSNEKEDLNKAVSHEVLIRDKKSSEQFISPNGFVVYKILNE